MKKLLAVLFMGVALSACGDEVPTTDATESNVERVDVGWYVYIACDGPNRMYQGPSNLVVSVNDPQCPTEDGSNG